MTPTFSAYDSTNLLLSDSESGGNVFLEDAGECQCSDFVYLGGSENGHTVSFSAIIRKDRSALLVSVPVVVGLGSHEPVAVILAGRIVAMVEYMQTIWNWAYAVLVAPSTGDDHSRTSRVEKGSIPELTVSRSEAASGPRPALIGAASIDLLPIATLGRQACTHYGSITRKVA